ncbi:predicted protein [Arabidopsis lyrata subsp. lyrata]|uniref:Predicted protein n=1 Tax=Arabidopsis lyrata subsp. lyrata TaxID=81972 RepID=D7KHJ0_ARALL|nr:predicted protein [Arabidopsis lyrata subsp. lyrata]
MKTSVYPLSEMETLSINAPTPDSTLPSGVKGWTILPFCLRQECVRGRSATRDENGYQCARVLSQKVPSTAGSCLRKLEGRIVFSDDECGMDNKWAAKVVLDLNFLRKVVLGLIFPK